MQVKKAVGLRVYGVDDGIMNYNIVGNNLIQIQIITHTSRPPPEYEGVPAD